MIGNELKCSICSIKLESEYMKKHGMDSDIYHKYKNHQCNPLCRHKQIIHNRFGILVCLNHKCECKDFPSHHIIPCQICEKNFVCSQCEYRRVINNNLYTNICSTCYYQ